MITAALGGISIAFTTTATVLNGIFAIALADATIPDVLRLLLFIAFALNIVCLAYQAFFTYVSVRKINNRAISCASGFRWRILTIGVVLASIALVLTIVVLIWLVTVRDEMPHKIALQTSQTIYIVWFAVWALSVFAEVAVFAFIAKWTTQLQRPNSVDHLDFGIHIPPMQEVRPTSNATRQSYQSQDPTLVSPPRTPRTPRTPTSSIRNSSSTRVGPGSSRVKLIQKGSARSSLDFPAGEATSIDSAFDRWDTSSVHHEIRANIHTSPPVTRSGLETIPGSRPESPANTLDGPFLPESPHPISSDALTAVDFYPSSPPRGAASSPPSSPLNFSRPTSRDQYRPVPNLLGSSMEDLIHPLFRPNSPRPPPIAIAGTMVTAAPNAGQAVTPRTLSRMRSNTGPWKTMPSSSLSNAGSPPVSPTVSQGPGSPGPSIAEEENLPPILPGFVLSAGQRSSFQWYLRRKSTKERPTSSYSKTSRRSSIQM
jgi:hypothetical protein